MDYLAASCRAFVVGGTACLVAAAGTTTAAQDLPPLQRLRSESPQIRAAIADGIRWSPSFRRLAEIVYASDAIVYIEEGRCRAGVAACLLMAITAAGPFRVLHVRANTRKLADCRLTAAIGHELHHVAEVIENPRIRSGLQAYAFFDRVGPTNHGRFETQAAITTGLKVDREACGRDRRVPAIRAPQGDLAATSAPPD